MIDDSQFLTAQHELYGRFKDLPVCLQANRDCCLNYSCKTFRQLKILISPFLIYLSSRIIFVSSALMTCRNRLKRPKYPIL